MSYFFEIENLTVEVNSKEIIKDLNFSIKKNSVIALLGPNGSGKSTLAKVISGDPRYKIKKGNIKFNGKDITKFSLEKRSQEGILMIYQNPPEIDGIKMIDLIDEIKQNDNYFKVEKLLEREVNKGFSGGEKKLSELMQITAMNPKLLILDEIDSGLDIKKVDEVSEIIKKFFIKKGVSVLIITHNGKILDLLKPSAANIMIDGKIIGRDENYKEVLKTIQKHNYEKCKKCTKFLSGE